jgi:hypothetical protein
MSSPALFRRVCDGGSIPVRWSRFLRCHYVRVGVVFGGQSSSVEMQNSGSALRRRFTGRPLRSSSLSRADFQKRGLVARVTQRVPMWVLTPFGSDMEAAGPAARALGHYPKSSAGPTVSTDGSEPIHTIGQARSKLSMSTNISDPRRPAANLTCIHTAANMYGRIPPHFEGARSSGTS